MDPPQATKKCAPGKDFGRFKQRLRSAFTSKSRSSSSGQDPSPPGHPPASASSTETGNGKIKTPSPPISRPITNDSLPPTSRPTNEPSQNSSTKNVIRTAWHGVEQLLPMVEKSLAGTPFQGAVGALNAIIEVVKVRSLISLYRAMLEISSSLTGSCRQPGRSQSTCHTNYGTTRNSERRVAESGI